MPVMVLTLTRASPFGYRVTTCVPVKLATVAKSLISDISRTESDPEDAAAHMPEVRDGQVQGGPPFGEAQ